VRVVALTTDPSLSVALGMIGDWDIVDVDGPEALFERAEGANAGIVGLGTVGEGVRTVRELRERGLTLALVVVGDGPGPEDPPCPFVERPFSLGDIRDAIDLARASLPQPPAPAEPAAPGAHRAAPAERAEATSPESPAAVAPATQPARAVRAPEPPAIPVDPYADPDAPSPRWRRRRQADEPPAIVAEEPGPPPLLDRLQRAARAVAVVDELLDEIPSLGDAARMSSAVVEEVQQVPGVRVVAVYVRSGEEFFVAGSSDLSPTERGMTVHDDHPLVRGLRDRTEVTLFDSTDAARSMLGGVAGSRSAALVVAPVAMEGRLWAFVVAGGDRFGPEQLGRIEAICAEAGPGLVVASVAERLRASR